MFNEEDLQHDLVALEAMMESANDSEVRERIKGLRGRYRHMRDKLEIELYTRVGITRPAALK